MSDVLWSHWKFTNSSKPCQETENYRMREGYKVELSQCGGISSPQVLPQRATS